MKIDDRALQNALRREKKRRNKYDHTEDGRSVFTIRDQQQKRSDEIKRRKRRKERILEKEASIG